MALVGVSSLDGNRGYMVMGDRLLNRNQARSHSLRTGDHDHTPKSFMLDVLTAFVADIGKRT